MAITVIKQPLTSILTPNLLGLPLEFVLQTDNMIENEGALGIYKLSTDSFETYPTNGKKLRVFFYNYRLEFTCTDSPDAANNEIPNMTANTQAAAHAWALAVASTLNNNALIREHWWVSGAGYYATGAFGRFRFAAKYKATSLSILWPPNLTTGYFDSWLSVDTESESLIIRENFFINIQILTYYETLTKISLKPDGDGKVKFDVNNILEELWNVEIPINDDYIKKIEDAFRLFYLSFNETWGVAMGGDTAYTNIMTPVLYGNIGAVQASLYNENNMSWGNDPSSFSTLLSKRKKESYAKIGQYLYFGYFLHKSVSNLIIKVTGVDNGGHLTALSEAITPSGISFNSYIEFNIGKFIKQLNEIITAAGNTLESINFKVTADGYFAEGVPNSGYIFSYNIFFLEELMFGLEFIYKNDFGYYDSIICTGFEKETNIYDKVKEIHKHGVQENTTKRQIQQQKSQMQVSHLTNTGLLSEEDLAMYNEMWLSDDVFVVKDGIKIPILIDKSSIKTIDSRKDLQDLQFKYRHSYKDSAVSITDTSVADICKISIKHQAATVNYNQNATVTVERTGSLNDDVSVILWTDDGTAVSVVNYEHFNQVLTWKAGDAEAKIFPVKIIGNKSGRPLQFYVKIDTPINCTIAPIATKTITILSS